MGLWQGRTALPLGLLSLVLLALQLCPAALAITANEATEPFIGWAGESYQPVNPLQKNKHDSTARWVELISWAPRVYVYHNFLTPAECDHIIHKAAPTMRKSLVRGANNTSVVRDDYRTSFGGFINRRIDPLVDAIDERLARWAKIPPVHGEDLQVLRYAHGQEYKPHRDTLMDHDAGPRVVTVVLYLSDVEEGGETAFTDVQEWVHPDLPKRYGPFSSCAQGKVAVRPRKGDAVMFWSIHPDGKTEDELSMHQGCPVLKGVKWTATKWIHARPFRQSIYDNPEQPDLDPGLCKDSRDKCAEWAASGECKHNPGFMVGDVGSVGKCLKSCDACKQCDKGDVTCYNENRRNAGFLVYDAAEIGLAAVPGL